MYNFIKAKTKPIQPKLKQYRPLSLTTTSGINIRVVVV